jgi:Rps23 Pro-64 3,4-dihydroxylase Tpa1-like proline 4-hydroxylase|tara:strand:+ start:37 stop:648 length:612 start_codon:yes stop_codon:yes gene_type:complete
MKYKNINMEELKINQDFRWFITRPNFFSKDECEYMIKHIDKTSTRKKGHYTENREDSSSLTWDTTEDSNVCMLNISRTEEQKYLDKFWSAIQIANITTFKYNLSGIFENRVQAHRYDVGDWYNPHADFHSIQKFSSVKLTCIVFLNDQQDYEGGEFRMFDGTIIEPEVGKLIIHPAFAGHEVKPVTKGERYSCVCWAVGDTFV